MKKFELQFLFFLILFLGFNFMLKPVLASQVIDQQFNSSASRAQGNNIYFQTFTPAQNNFSHWYMSGFCDSGHYGAITINWALYDNSNNLLTSGVVNNNCNSNNNVYLTFTPTSPVGLTPSALYKMQFQNSGDNTYGFIYAWGYTGGNAGGGSLNGSEDFFFNEYYETTYTPPPPQPTWQIQLLTPATTTPFTTYYGQPASYTFNYMNPLNWYPQIRFMVKRKADALAAAWPDYVNSATFWTTSATTSTLTYGTAKFQLPDGYYDLRVDFWANIPQMLGKASTTFTINTGGSYGGYSFATSTLIKPPTFSTSDVCGDIATSTMFGAIECGMTKAFVNAITWAFAPSFDTLNNFKVSYELFKGCFPFNAYFQLTDTLTNAASSTASTTSGTIKIPFIHSIAGGHTFYMLDAISSSTLSNWIGATNYTLFRTTIGYFFWLIAAAIVFFTIKYI